MKTYKAYAKVNIFLKITGTRGDYHELISRFVKLNSLYDELSFVKKTKRKEFEILGEFSCQREQNTIYKAFVALKEATQDIKIDNFFSKYAINVKKTIPAFAGLGGGSSDAASFLKMCNKELDLNLSVNELATIGLKVGADVPFFIYGYDSANVGGVGEIVEEFNEEVLEIETFTPDVKISTPKVYQVYRSDFFAPIDAKEADRFKNAKSIDILKYTDAYSANDLFKPALQEYKELKRYFKNGWHFSGSGSSFFRLKK